jgi:hypothetical protein
LFDVKLFLQNVQQKGLTVIVRYGLGCTGADSSTESSVLKFLYKHKDYKILTVPITFIDHFFGAFA